MYSLIIPVYNEEENIQILYKEIIESCETKEIEIIFVNDNSDDSSSFYINQLIKKDKRVKIIDLQNRSGQSYAIYKGVEYSSFDVIITLDCDLQNDPKDINNLIEIFNNNNYGLVGGIRYKRKDGFVKKISSVVANNIRSFILKDGCKDTGCSLKVFKKDIFLKIPFFDGLHRFLPALFIAHKENLFFCNVNHRPRVHGISKYGVSNRLFKGIRDIIKVMKIIKTINKKYD